MVVSLRRMSDRQLGKYRTSLVHDRVSRRLEFLGDPDKKWPEEDLNDPRYGLTNYELKELGRVMVELEYRGYGATSQISGETLDE
jgi:hypothetical protein